MAILGTGGKYKNLGTQALLEATTLSRQQRDIDFGRELLQNIRQERIARSQILMGTQSDDVISTGAQGSLANIESSLAGEIGYAYETGKRLDKISALQEEAQRNFDRYAKVNKRNAAVGQVLGTAGAVIGSIIPGIGTVAGAAIGGAIGTGLTSAMGGGRAGTSSAAIAAAQTTATIAMSGAAGKATPGAEQGVNKAALSTEQRLASVLDTGGMPTAYVDPNSFSLYNLDTLKNNFGVWGA